MWVNYNSRPHDYFFVKGIDKCWRQFKQLAKAVIITENKAVVIKLYQYHLSDMVKHKPVDFVCFFHGFSIFLV